MYTHTSYARKTTRELSTTGYHPRPTRNLGHSRVRLGQHDLRLETREKLTAIVPPCPTASCSMDPCPRSPRNWTNGSSSGTHLPARYCTTGQLPCGVVGLAWCWNSRASLLRQRNIIGGDCTLHPSFFECWCSSSTPKGRQAGSLKVSCASICVLVILDSQENNTLGGSSVLACFSAIAAKLTSQSSYTACDLYEFDRLQPETAVDRRGSQGDQGQI